MKTAIGGAHGCTHITELLGPMATTAFQTLYGEIARRKREQAEAGIAPKEGPAYNMPSLANSCVAYAE